MNRKRSFTWLGLLNTIMRYTINRVIVEVVDIDTEKTLRWYVDKATNHPLVNKESSK